MDSSQSKAVRRACELEPLEIKKLKESAIEAFTYDRRRKRKQELTEEQVNELVGIHESYLAYRDSSEPFVSDVRFLSEANLCDYYKKMRNRARKLLDSLEDKAGKLRKAPVYQNYLSDLVLTNVIKEVKWVLRFCESVIEADELIKSPEKMISFLESNKVRFVPAVDRLPADILDRIRKRKRRKGGPIPDALLHGYIRNMAAWYNTVAGRHPSPRSARFADLVNRCLNVIDENPMISEKMIRSVLCKRP
jgi:hypothetical protein